MSDDYLWDRSGPEDPEIAKLESLLAPLAYTEVRRKRRYWIPAVAIVGAAILAFVLWPRGGACSGDGFAFSATSGTVGCGSSELASGALPVGATLDTHDTTATLAIASIGTASLAAHTRVRLERTGADRHQLFLEEGSMHARVNAPPRLFAVSTPSSEVTDLGCEYEITVDPRGAGSIHVLGGKVELDTKGGVIIAPAGTHAAIHPGRSPGYPVSITASEAFASAVVDYEAGVAGALDRLLAAATVSDSITLINMAIIEPDRPEIVRRLVEVTSLPDGLTKAQVLADPASRGLWREAVVDTQVRVGSFLER